MASAKIKKERSERILESLSNNISKLPLVSLPHEVFPGPNCAAVVDDAFELKAELNNRITIPYPVFVSSQKPESLQVCAKRVKESYDYNHKLKRYKSFYKSSLEKKKYKAYQNKNIYPYIVYKYAEHLEQNPDPYFSGNYDWYFTGGNLEKLNDRYILHTTGQHLESLSISKIDGESKQIKLNQIASQVPLNFLDETSTILEIRTNQLCSSNNFMLRRKNSISVLKYDENSIESQFYSTSELVPYISGTFGASPNELLTSDLSKCVKLWDMNKPNKPMQLLFEAEESIVKDKNWNCIQAYDRDIYAFTELHKFTLLDSRVSKKRVKRNFFNLEKAYELCENISSMFVSEFNNLIYFGTTHKIIGVDPRYMAENSENKNYIVQRWVHQMELSPSIIKTYRRNDTEYLVASSQINGDMRIIENHMRSPPDDCLAPFQEFSSYVLPVKPPSTSDALVSIRCRGNCLDPAANFQKRLKTIPTGICFAQQLNNLSFITAYSNADIFAQAFVQEENEQSYNKKLTEMWVDMENTLLSHSPSMKEECLMVTAVKNMKGMDKVFRCQALNTIKKYPEYDKLESTKRPRRWQRPIEKLQKCKDVLSSDMLQIWDIEFDKKVKADISTNSMEEGDGESKVSQWLNENTNTNDMVSIPMSSVRNDTIMDTSNLLNITQQSIAETSMKKTRKKIYVKGF